MIDLINRVFAKDGSPSKEIAKERLRLVLVHDRVNVSPQFLETLKEDMIKVISHYMDIDDKGMEISLVSSNASVALLASIPVKRMKRMLPAEDGENT